MRAAIRRQFGAYLLGLCLAAGAGALTPQQQADRLYFAAEQALAQDRPGTAHRHLKAARELDTSLPANHHYLMGQALRQQNRHAEARDELERYVEQAGDEGAYYREALLQITALEREMAAASGDGSGEEADIHWSRRDDDWLTELQSLYGLDDPAETLRRHINNLLEFHAYRDERIIAASRLGPPSRHRIHLSDRDEIISMSRLGPPEDARVESERLRVYGIDPRLESECTAADASCWFLHPRTGQRWLQVSKSQTAVDDLRRTFAELIRQMQ